MYEFLWWWLFALLPLPLLIRWWLKPAEQAEGVALKVPFLEDFQQGKQLLGSSWYGLLALLLASVAWVMLVAAAARPVWIGDTVAMPVSGRDLMLAVDLSGSMQEQDFILNGQVVDRLVATKAVAGEFVRKRTGDRVGMVLFGDQAYLQVPLTFDRQTVLQLLNESQIGLAGERTAIGDAIGLALKRLQASPEKNRVLILMTDGANTAGSVSPLEAADMAAAAGLKIYTVGIGSESDQMRSVFGFQLMNPTADLDEKTLKSIAERTGGAYFRARDTEEFHNIYAELDRLEPAEKEAQQWRPQQELFRWPLLAAFVLSMAAAVLRLNRE
ncbi:VWA domain-containing protein [Thiothrix litoralis]|uniref:VWA domain-containing protein n=2 Tax=Thiothrix TaxID=1030 RepID=A0ABY9MPX8_9GAMM|nr:MULTISPECIES: VWA domain-containing protein [Thiothrix]QTR47604.1 VWA domain-containing protein [Thiothrix litoralis]WML90457.1 VWA domain-containing protein [Thiothrix lacustris]